MNFGPLPDKRPVPDFVQKQSAEDLALRQLRQRGTLAAERHKALENAEKPGDRLAEQLALQVHKKRFTEKDPLVLSLRQLLRSEGISLITYVGEEVTETLEDEADIVEWLPPNGDPVDRVVDALEPEVRWHGKLLHRAKLSCRQAAEDELPQEPHPTAPELPELEDTLEAPAPRPEPSVPERILPEQEPEPMPEPTPMPDLPPLSDAELIPQPMPEPDAEPELRPQAEPLPDPEEEPVSEPDSEPEDEPEPEEEVEEDAEDVPEPGPAVKGEGADLFQRAGRRFRDLLGLE